MPTRLPWRSLPLDQWPADLAKRWSSITKDWTVRRRKEGREALGFLLAAPGVSLDLPDESTVMTVLEEVARGLSPESAQKKVAALYGALIALYPNHDWLWLRQQSKGLRRRARGEGAARVTPKPKLRYGKVDWPARHRERWEAALRPSQQEGEPSSARERFEQQKRMREQAIPVAGDFACGDREGVVTDAGGRSAPLMQPADWSAETKRQAERGWGQWLWWVDHHDPGEPYERLTDDRVLRYLDSCVARGCKLRSVRAYLSTLLLAARVVLPGWDGSDVGAVFRVLDAMAKETPVKKPEASLPDLVALGIELCRSAMTEANSPTSAVKFRDGFLILFLCWRPKRLRNLHALAVDESFEFDEDGAPDHVCFGETKNRSVSRMRFPKALVPFFRHYLTVVRPLLAAPDEPAFWVSTHGKGLNAVGIRRAVVGRTKAALGISVSPHHVRTIMATSMMQERAGLLEAISGMLDHRDPRSRESYIAIPPTMEGSRAVNAVLDQFAGEAANGRGRRQAGNPDRAPGERWQMS